MSDRHEAFLARLFEGRVTKGSGSHWTDQMDGKQARDSSHVVFVWDGKSTLGKGLTVTVEMWNKAIEQASVWEVPMLALRWYASERLDKVHLDLAVVEASVLAELQSEAKEVIALREEVARLKAKIADPNPSGAGEYSAEGTHSWRGNR